MFWFFNHKAYGVLALWPGIKPLPPTLEVWSLNHWTTREVLRSYFFKEPNRKCAAERYSKWNGKFTRGSIADVSWQEKEDRSSLKVSPLKLSCPRNRKKKEWRKWTEPQRQAAHHHFSTVPKGEELLLWDRHEDPVALTVSKVRGQPRVAQEMPLPFPGCVSDSHLAYIPTARNRQPCRRAGISCCDERWPTDTTSVSISGRMDRENVVYIPYTMEYHSAI